jgi:hypothetical protein
MITWKKMVEAAKKEDATLASLVLAYFQQSIEDITEDLKYNTCDHDESVESSSEEKLDARDIAIIFAGRIKRFEGNPPAIMATVNAIESAILHDREARKQ